MLIVINIFFIAGLLYLFQVIAINIFWFEQADVPPHIEKLCFPDAADWPPPPPPSPSSQPSCGGNDEQSYSLVITSNTGVRRFGYCRRVQPEGSNLCLPLAYCIISPFRASGFYYKVFKQTD